MYALLFFFASFLFHWVIHKPKQEVEGLSIDITVISLGPRASKNNYRGILWLV
jgi:hypothetical protein